MTKSDTTEKPTKPENPHAQAYAGFLRNTERHRLTVINDNGLDRHLHVGAPGTGIWAWRVITWPHYLTTVGDVADGYTFSRIDDMLDFFDRAGHTDYFSDGAPSIDFRYWAEKLSRGGRDVREYSETAFIDTVRTTLEQEGDMSLEAQAEHETLTEVTRRVCLRNGIPFDEFVLEGRANRAHRLKHFGQDLPGRKFADVQIDIDPSDTDELDFFGQVVPEHSPGHRRRVLVDAARDASEDIDSARRWLQAHQDVFGQDAYWDWDLTEYKTDFLLACYAIELTVRLWREYEKTPEAEARRNPGDSYIHLEGGLVQNNPALPVFDLDVLESDAPDAAAASEALGLYGRISEHPHARVDLAEPLTALADFVRAHGLVSDVDDINTREARRALAAQPAHNASTAAKE